MCGLDPFYACICSDMTMYVSGSSDIGMHEYVTRCLCTAMSCCCIITALITFDIFDATMHIAESPFCGQPGVSANPCCCRARCFYGGSNRLLETLIDCGS